jgi:hypothetical protein
VNFLNWGLKNLQTPRLFLLARSSHYVKLQDISSPSRSVSEVIKQKAHNMNDLVKFYFDNSNRGVK